MDSLERLIRDFRAQPTAPVLHKLDVLLELEQLRDPRVVPFLLQTLRDGQEPLEVRMRVIRLLRAVRCPADLRASVGRYLSEFLADRESPELRVSAAVTLAQFTDIPGFVSALGAVALDSSETLDLRYSAFSSLERVGPTPECTVLLHNLEQDEALGQSARSLLARWRLA